MSSDRARNTSIRDIFALGAASTLSVLQCDFGHWPPRGLTSIAKPDIPIDFKTFFRFSRSKQGAVLDHLPTTIFINKRLLLPHVFNRISADLGDTVSHENIHVLQNKIMHAQGLVPVRENYGDYLNGFAHPDMKSTSANINELQANLHAVTSDHYRRTGNIPLNTADLWALLRTERVIPKSAYVDDLLDNTMEGRWAKKRFPDTSSRPRKDLLMDVAELNVLFFFMKKDKRDEFCEDILPAVYGRLLEIYGDQFGCMRMGYNHNLLLGETFARQARDLKNGTARDSNAIEQTIATMPLSQIGCLEREIPRNGGWKHKRTGNPVALAPETIDLVGRLLRRHTAPL